MKIDWSNPATKISKYFTVKEALYLPSWGILHTPTEEEKANILTLAQKMDVIREFLGKPVNVHCWIRPTSVNCPGSIYNGKNYNLYVRGALMSSHIYGKAVDFTVSTITASDTRSLLLPHLEEWNVRMEDISGNWVHIDNTEVKPGKKRFFKP